MKIKWLQFLQYSFVLTFTFLLSACEFGETINVFSDPRGLRGSYQGVVKDYPTPGEITQLRLELTPTVVLDNSYQLEGTFTLGNAPPLAIKGSVSGGTIYRFSPQAMIATSQFEVYETDKVIWTMHISNPLAADSHLGYIIKRTGLRETFSLEVTRVF
jgi:hypothetical protein